MCNSQTSEIKTVNTELKELREWSQLAYEAFAKVSMNVLIKQQKERVTIVDLKPLLDVMDIYRAKLVGVNKREQNHE